MHQIPLEKHAELLPLYTGKQYVVEPPVSASVTTVRRVWRSSASEASTTALYYVLDGTAYAAPTLAAVLRARMSRTVANLTTALHALQRFTQFDVLRGYAWNEQPDAAAMDAEESVASGGAEEEAVGNALHTHDVEALALHRYFGRDRPHVHALLDDFTRRFPAVDASAATGPAATVPSKRGTKRARADSGAAVSAVSSGSANGNGSDQGHGGAARSADSVAATVATGPESTVSALPDTKRARRE